MCKIDHNHGSRHDNDPWHNHHFSAEESTFGGRISISIILPRISGIGIDWPVNLMREMNCNFQTIIVVEIFKFVYI